MKINDPPPGAGRREVGFQLQCETVLLDSFAIFSSLLMNETGVIAVLRIEKILVLDTLLKAEIPILKGLFLNSLKSENTLLI